MLEREKGVHSLVKGKHGWKDLERDMRLKEIK